MVDCQASDRGSADRGVPREDRPFPMEVVSPDIAARMEQPDGGSGQRIDAREVWSLVDVAAEATEAEVVGSRRPAMLLGHDVVDREREERVIMFVDSAVFATPFRPFTHLRSEPLINLITSPRHGLPFCEPWPGGSR